MRAPRKKLRATFRFFRFHFLRRLWLLLLIAGWTAMCLFSLPSEATPLAMAKELANCFETFLIVPAVILSIFIFTNPTELEFCQCYGFSPVKLGMAQLLPTIFFSLLSFGLAAFLFPAEALMIDPMLPWLLLLTSTVNLFAVVAAVVLARVLIRNLFGTMGAALVLYYGLTASSFAKGTYAYYFSGAALYEMQRQRLPLEMFYVNRMIFACIAILLSVASFLILRSSHYGEKDA